MIVFWLFKLFYFWFFYESVKVCINGMSIKVDEIYFEYLEIDLDFF